MLSLDQAREYNRYKKLSVFFAGQTTVYSSFAPFASQVADFNANFAALEALIPGKNVNTTGTTTDKITLKHQVADALALMLNSTKAYAITNGNAQLLAETNYNASDIFKLKDANLLPFVLHVQSVITPLFTDANYTPYGVTAAALANTVTLAANFNSLIGVASVSGSTGSIANNNINLIIKKLHDNTTIFDLLVNNFRATNPDFVAGYQINSALEQVGVRHSGIQGLVVSGATGSPVAGAIIVLADTTKSAVTDLKGLYRLERVTAGDYTVDVSASGFTSQSFTQTINRGELTEVDVTLL